MQNPAYLTGRVIMDNGLPVPEAVSVGLICGSRSVQVIRTDLKGYFQFTLGAGIQSNADMSADNDTSLSPTASGVRSDSGFGGLGRSGTDLLGCDVQVSVPGFQPISKVITDPGDIGNTDAGTMQLRRIVGVEGSSISVTSLLVPDNARKEFDKGDKDARSNKLVSATQHLEKAVAEYDKYAAAWNELGNLYLANHETEKADKALEKAIAADPKYIPPYMTLASLELQNAQYESALETAGKALELDPSSGQASFIQAGADFKLNRPDAAEKSALDAQKQPHQNIPQLHVLLAEIFVQKHDYVNAAAQMRAYLKEAPQGRLASEVKHDLEQIEKSAAGTDSSSSQPRDQPQIAP
jgi:tetratricopeptide (TPR) repeat protein